MSQVQALWTDNTVAANVRAETGAPWAKCQPPAQATGQHASVLVPPDTGRSGVRSERLDRSRGPNAGRPRHLFCRGLALATSAVLALSGCSTASGSASLKESCAALNAVLQEFGQVAPTAQRYAAYAPKVKAISEAGDAATKDALQPLVAALEKGAQGGDSMGAMGAQLTATLTLMPQCANAGAPLTAASSAPSPSPSAILLDATEYHAAISETKRSCDGDTCAVTARVAVGYTGVEDDPGRALVKVTITGGSEPESRSVIVDSDEVNTFEVAATVPKGRKLYVVVERAETA